MSSDDECVDFVSEFFPRFPHIIAQIFSYLTASQLTIISCVSKKWRKACKHDTKARKRKTIYLRMIKKLRKAVGEENWPIRERTIASITQSTTKDTTITRKPLKSVISNNQIGSTTALSSCIDNTVNTVIKSR